MKIYARHVAASPIIARRDLRQCPWRIGKSNGAEIPAIGVMCVEPGLRPRRRAARGCSSRAVKWRWRPRVVMSIRQHHRGEDAAGCGGAAY